MQSTNMGAFRVLLLITLLSQMSGTSLGHETDTSLSHVSDTSLSHVSDTASVSGRGKKDCRKAGNECDTANGFICMTLLVGNPGNKKIRCAKPQGRRRWCDPTLTSQEACKAGLSCQQNKNGQYKCRRDETRRSQCLSSESSWKLTYHHDANGNIQMGNITDFIAEVKGGADVKVWTPFYGLVNVQKVSVDGAENGICPDKCVYAQALFWTQQNSQLYNLYLVFATSGNIHNTKFYKHDPENVDQTNSNVGSEMKWFTRNSALRVNNKMRLMRNMKDGAAAKVSVAHTITDLDVIDLSNREIKGVSINEMRDILCGREFNITEQVQLRNWSYSGLIHTASWLLNNHTLEATNVTDGQKIHYLVDPCWSPVYKNSETGSTLSGSLGKLKAAVEAGKGIRLQIDDKYYKANIIIQPDGTEEISAQVFDSINFDVNDGIYEWLNVDTTGNVNTVQFEIGGNRSVGNTTTKMKVTWFAEERVWTKVNSTVFNDKIAAGASARYSVHIQNATKWYQPDYAQEIYYVILNGGATVQVPVHTMYNEREVISNGPNHIRRYSFVKWNVYTYIYHDYLVGDTEQLEQVTVANANISLFTSAVLN